MCKRIGEDVKINLGAMGRQTGEPGDFPEISTWRPCGWTGFYERVSPPSPKVMREFVHPVRDALIVVRGNGPAAVVEITGLDMAKQSVWPAISSLQRELVSVGLEKLWDLINGWVFERLKIRKRGGFQGSPLEGLERRFEQFQQEQKDQILSMSRWIIIEAISMGLLDDWMTQGFVYPFQNIPVVTSEMVDHAQAELKNLGVEAIVSGDPTFQKPTNDFLKKEFGIEC